MVVVEEVDGVCEHLNDKEEESDEGNDGFVGQGCHFWKLIGGRALLDSVARLEQMSIVKTVTRFGALVTYMYASSL